MYNHRQSLHKLFICKALTEDFPIIHDEKNIQKRQDRWLGITIGVRDIPGNEKYVFTYQRDEKEIRKYRS